MQSSDKPNKFNIPFASGGSKRTIPQASQIGITDGAASLTDGFPPLTFTPVSAGGKGPSGLDFNGLLNQMTAADRWAMAGGGYAWDSAFSTAIGGYPKGARVLKSDGSGYWQSTTENNITNPDTGGAGWISDFTNKTITAGKVLGRDTSGTGVVQELPIAVDTNGNVFFTGANNSVTSTSTNSSGANYKKITNGTVELRIGITGANTGILFTASNHSLGLGVNGAESAQIDTSGNFKFDSGYGAVQTAYGCRARVQFNGSTGTIPSGGSGGVTSVTRSSTGKYVVNLSFTMPDTNYSASGIGKSTVSDRPINVSEAYDVARTTTSICITTRDDGGTYVDATTVSLNIFR
jgi:hypothetical protein